MNPFSKVAPDMNGNGRLINSNVGIRELNDRDTAVDVVRFSVHCTLESVFLSLRSLLLLAGSAMRRHQ